jgi:hypothetical protein
MPDTGAPISIGMQILQHGIELARRDGMLDLAKDFEMALSDLETYKKSGHATIDDGANAIIFRPFKGAEHGFEEEVLSGINSDDMIVPKEGKPKKE